MLFFFSFFDIWVLNYASEILQEVPEEETAGKERSQWGMPSMHKGLSKIFWYILPPLILVTTCKENVDSTILTDGDFLVLQGIKEFLQNQVDLEL